MKHSRGSRCHSDIQEVHGDTFQSVPCALRGPHDTHIGHDGATWTSQPAALPEPPDGTRLEFEHWTDVMAVWRDDASSAEAGWPAGDGGRVWCMYGRTVPHTWAWVVNTWGEGVMALAVRLVPHPDDLAKRAQWPTQLRADRELAAALDQMRAGQTKTVDPDELMARARQAAQAEWNAGAVGHDDDSWTAAE